MYTKGYITETLEATQLSPPINICFPNITVDNADAIHKVEEFHRTLAMCCTMYV